jgi:hypothetical protein
MLAIAGTVGVVGAMVDQAVAKAARLLGRH